MLVTQLLVALPTIHSRQDFSDEVNIVLAGNFNILADSLTINSD